MPPKVMSMPWSLVAKANARSAMGSSCCSKNPKPAAPPNMITAPATAKATHTPTPRQEKPWLFFFNSIVGRRQRVSGCGRFCWRVVGMIRVGHTVHRSRRTLPSQVVASTRDNKGTIKDRSVRERPVPPRGPGSWQAHLERPTAIGPSPPQGHQAYLGHPKPDRWARTTSPSGPVAPHRRRH